MYFISILDICPRHIYVIIYVLELLVVCETPLFSGPIIGSIPHPSLAIQTIESGAE